MAKRLENAILMLALTLCWAVSGLLPAAAQSRSVYVIANLGIEAEAKDAVAAKKKAMAEGQRQAMAILLRRLAPFGAYDRLPAPKLSIIEELIEGFRSSAKATQRPSIWRQSTSLFKVKGAAISRRVRHHRFRSPGPADQAAAGFVKDGQIVRSTVNPWRKAWRGLDLNNAVTPVKLAAVGQAVTADVVSGLQSDDDGAFETLSAAYPDERFVVALASYTSGEDKLATQFYGTDAGGVIRLVREDRVHEGDLNSSAKHAALVALRIFEGAGRR